LPPLVLGLAADAPKSGQSFSWQVEYPSHVRQVENLPHDAVENLPHDLPTHFSRGGEKEFTDEADVRVPRCGRAIDWVPKSAAGIQSVLGTDGRTAAGHCFAAAGATVLWFARGRAASAANHQRAAADIINDSARGAEFRAGSGWWHVFELHAQCIAAATCGVPRSGECRAD
jgi:hypothetical protein